MNKRIIAALLSGIMLITGITACSGSPATDSSSGTADSTTSVSESVPETEATTTDAPQTAAATTTTAETTTAQTTAATTEAATPAPETTKAPETAAPETTKAPEATKAPETTKAVTTTKAPETTKAVTTTKAATTTKAPAETPSSSDTYKIPSTDAMNFASKLMPGWNLGNQLEAVSGSTPSETAWGNPVITEKLIKAVKAAGFKSIRIPVSYLSKIGSAPNYTIDSAWLDRVQEVVDMCVDNGLYAIINVHGDGYYSISGGWLLCAESDQKTIKAKYEKVWTQIAARFKNYDEHLIFESMNEVFDGNYNGPTAEYYANINAYNQIFVDTVRKSGGKNANRYLLVPGWNTDINSTVEGTDFKLPTDSKNRIIVSVHYYDPYEFCLKESAKGIFRWGNAVTTQAPGWGKEDYLDGQFDKLYDSFISKGVPVIIGEYGAIDKSYNDERSTTYRAYFYEYLNYAAVKRGIVTVLWDNGYNGKNGFGVFDRSGATQTQPELIKAIMKGVKANYTITAPTV